MKINIKTPCGLVDDTRTTRQLPIVDTEELLRWAFQDQQVHSVYRAVCGDVRGAVSGGRDMLDKVGELATQVDSRRVGLEAAKCDPDAMAVYVAIEEFQKQTGDTETAGLLIENARSGREPYWWPDVEYEIYPMQDRRGRTVEITDRSDDQPNGHCPLQIEPHPDLIEFDRRQYKIWLDGMRWLTLELQGKLAKRIAAEPARDPEPWEKSV